MHAQRLASLIVRNIRQLFIYIPGLTYNLPYSFRSLRSPRPPRRRHLYPLPRLPELHLSVAQDASKWHHPFRQKHHFPQSDSMVHRRLDRRPRRRTHVQLCQARHR